MAKKSIEELEPGMVLAEDIKGAQGNLLLPKGATLSEKHIKVMKTWGIALVDIDLGDDALAYTPEQYEQAKKELEPRFIHADIGHILNKTLLDEAAKALATKIAESGSGGSNG